MEEELAIDSREDAVPEVQTCTGCTTYACMQWRKYVWMYAYMICIRMLHWLPISQRIQYHITAMVSWCVLCSYLCDLCCPVSVLASRRVLHSAARGELLVPRAHLATMQQRAFSVVGPSAWNDLPLSCIACWWPALPNFTSPSSPSSLAMTGLGAPLSSSVLKRGYISLQNEWMNRYVYKYAYNICMCACKYVCTYVCM